MSRISKRKRPETDTAVTDTNGKIYKVGIYARLSSAQDEKKNESIEVQIEIMNNYIENSPDTMIFVDTYSDLGKTGTNFLRSEFVRLLKDIRLGYVNCVIVKDLSRFGRDYIEAGNYIEKIFPFLGVRFISVIDDFDTEAIDVENQRTSVNIKNLIHDLYAKEFALKAEIHLKHRRKKGIYVGGVMPYGYTSLPTDKDRCFIADEQTGEIVTRIFDCFCETKCMNDVVRMLAQERIHTPRKYWESKEVYCPYDKEYKTWDRKTVKKILTSRTYTGVLEQGKSKIHGRKEENRIWLNQEEWIVHDRHHVPLTKIETFGEIQQFFKEKEKERKQKNCLSRFIPLKENIFREILICGVCGKKLVRHSVTHYGEKGKLVRNEYYDCMNAYRLDDLKCVTNRISAEKITSILLQILEKEISLNTKQVKKLIIYNQQLAKNKKRQYRQGISAIEKKVTLLDYISICNYTEYRDGIMTKEEYLQRREADKRKGEGYLNELKEIKNKKLELEKQIKKCNMIIKNMIQMKKNSVFTTEIISTFFKVIKLYPKKRIEVKFAFTIPQGKGNIL